MLNRRKKLIQVWNRWRVSKWLQIQFGWTIPYSTLGKSTFPVLNVRTYCWEWRAACLQNRMPEWKGSAFPKQIPSLAPTWSVWQEVKGSVAALAFCRGTQIKPWDCVTDAQPQYQCNVKPPMLCSINSIHFSVCSDEWMWQEDWKQKPFNRTWSWAPDGGGDWAAAVVEEVQSLKLSAEPEHTVA